jgi:hypothetical protein
MHQRQNPLEYNHSCPLRKTIFTPSPVPHFLPRMQQTVANPVTVNPDVGIFLLIFISTTYIIKFSTYSCCKFIRFFGLPFASLIRIIVTPSNYPGLARVHYICSV